MIFNKLKREIKKTNIGLKIVLFYHMMRKLKYSKLNDEEFAKRIYKKSGFGKLNLDTPKTFDEKLWWLKVNYSDPLMTDCTDKIKVRQYVSERGYPHILNEIYGKYSNAKEIEWDTLPHEFYFKTNHSSDTNIYVKNKELADKKYIEKRLDLYLKKDHYSLSREWNYKNIDRLLYAEKKLDSNKELIDYKFLCSYGKVNGLFVDTGIADETGGHSLKTKRNVYDENFNLLDVTVTRPNFDAKNFCFPENILEMKSIAEVLSEPFPFSRIDLYNIEGKIIFGEITFFHAGGVNSITPIEYEKKLGSWITLPNYEEEN